MKKSKYSLGVVAVVPFWSNSDNMNADSNYSYLRTVLPEMVKLVDDRTLFLLFFPDPKVGSDKWYYIPDGLQSDRVQFVKWPYDTRMQSGILSFHPLRIKEIETNYGVNGYWLHQVEMESQLYGGYEKSFTWICRPWIVAQHHYIIHESLPYPMYSQFSRLWQQMGGTVAADKVVLNSKHTLTMMRETFGTYFTEERMKEIDEKSSVLRFGLIEEEREPAPEANNKTEIRVIYNHRFEAYKQHHVTFGVLEDLRTRHKFEVWATQTPGQSSGAHKIDRSMYFPKKEDYLKGISIPAINTINSLHETFCIAMLDSISLGHLCVVPRGITFEELLPEDYPYFFSNPKEQTDILDHLMKNFKKEYNHWRLKLHKHAKERFGVISYAKAYLDILQEAETRYKVNEHRESTAQNWNKFVATLEKGQRFPLNYLRRSFGKMSGLQQQALPTRRIIRELDKDDRVKFRIDVQSGEVVITIL